MKVSPAVWEELKSAHTHTDGQRDTQTKNYGGYVNTLLGYEIRLHFLSHSKVKVKVDVVLFSESKCRVMSRFEMDPLRIDCAGVGI